MVRGLIAGMVILPAFWPSNMSVLLSAKSEIIIIRDWSLITGRGGPQNVKFHPYEKGGGKKF